MMGLSVNLRYVRFGLIPVVAGEALEEELNKAGPGSCKFMTCDVSKEEDLKVRPGELLFFFFLPDEA
jgi:hypothetical protein